MVRFTVLLALGLLLTACSSAEKTVVSRVPAAALIVGRDGGLVLIHKAENGMFAIKQCQDFVPLNKEQDCRLAAGTEVREVSRDQIVAEIAGILQLPRFKPEISEEMAKSQKAAQTQLFRCADSLSLLKYEIHRRQKFGETYGFFKEDMSKLEKLLAKSQKSSCSQDGMNRIQKEIDAVNTGILNDIIALVESDEMHVISAPQLGQKSKEVVPLGLELSNSLVSYVEVVDSRTVLPKWILERDSKHMPLQLGFYEAFNHCKALKSRLPTIAELAAYASTKGAKYLAYGASGNLPKGKRIGSIELETLDTKDAVYSYQRYYKFWYEASQYKNSKGDFLGEVSYVWSSSMPDNGKTEVYSFLDGEIANIKKGGLEKKMAVVCVYSDDENSFKFNEIQTRTW